MSKQNSSKPVPVFDHINPPYGHRIKQEDLSNDIPRYWAPEKGGGPVTVPGHVTFDTIMPNGETPHGGILTFVPNVGPVAVFHYARQYGY